MSSRPNYRIENAPDQGSPPVRLRLSHVRSVFRLLCEVRELGSSPIAWRRHLVNELLRLVRAETCVATEAVIPKPPSDLRLLGMVIGGVSERRLVPIYRASVERSGWLLEPTQEGHVRGVNSTSTRTRQEMAARHLWRQRPDVDPWRVLGCDYFICSNQYVPSKRWAHILILTRSSRRGPFGELERRIVGLLHAELGRTWRHAREEALIDLSPQLHRTLDLLLEGLSEGAVAARLGLSPHTVHDHVKRLYRHFQVSSRAQLLARVARFPLLRAPRLCIDLLGNEDDETFDSVELADVASGNSSLVADASAVSSRTTKA